MSTPFVRPFNSNTDHAAGLHVVSVGMLHFNAHSTSLASNVLAL